MNRMASKTDVNDEQNDVKKTLNNLTRFRVRFSGATDESGCCVAAPSKNTVLPDFWPNFERTNIFKIG